MLLTVKQTNSGAANIALKANTNTNICNFTTTTDIDDQLQLKNSKYKILLVEDEPIIQKVHTIYLAKLGYKFELAVNGKQAIEMYRNKPDLILLDIGLPDIDGVQACAAIRTIEQQLAVNSRIPIIALTAYSIEEVEDGWSAGIDYIAQKPLKITELQSILNYYLSTQSNIKKAALV